MSGENSLIFDPDQLFKEALVPLVLKSRTEPAHANEAYVALGVEGADLAGVAGRAVFADPSGRDATAIG